MKRGIIAVAALGAVSLIAVPLVWASGYHSTITIFESHAHPDLPLDKFAGGDFGLIKPTWSKSFRYAVYRYLAGPGFDPAEQKALLATWNAELGLRPQPDNSFEEPVQPESYGAPFTSSRDTDAGLAEWIGARNRIVPRLEQVDRIGIYRPARSYFGLDSPGDEAYVGAFYFPNCNASSFHTATATLHTMTDKFGASSPAVKLWLAAQDQVFVNCSGTPAHLKFEEEQWSAAVDEWNSARNKVPDVPSPPSFSGSCRGTNFHAAAVELNQMIARLGASNPQLKQWVDARDQALTKCGEQPPYSANPSPTPTPAPVIPHPLTEGTPFEREQRTYQIACATFYAGNYEDAARMFDAIAADSSSPWRTWGKYLAARAIVRKGTLSGPKNDPAVLALAETQLKTIIASPPDASVKASAQRLLSFVEFRIHPEQRTEEVAHALLQPRSEDTLEQNLADYVAMFDHGTKRADGTYADDMTDWLATFEQTGPSDHAITRWKTARSLPWLIAAITMTAGSDANASALLDAAAKVKPGSRAYLTLAFHSARLLLEQQKIDEARTKLDALLAIRNTLPRSTVNEIARLRMKTARNLDELLTYAQRVPLGITSDDDNSDIPFDLNTATWWPPGEVDRVKGLLAGPLFDDDGAEVMSRWVPLSIEVRAAQSPILASDLSAQVALAAWTRAIVLQDDDSARELVPLLGRLVPELKQQLDTWRSARNSKARRFDAAFILLTHPGMRPYLAVGIGRDTPLSEMSSFRDNWWSRILPREQIAPTAQAGVTHAIALYPIFLSSEQRRSADEELRELSTINAPSFLCTEAIGEAKRNPDEERVPLALHRCIGAVHLGCSNDEGSELAKQAFNILHRNYADSAWARKDRFWYKGTGCEKPTPTPSPSASPSVER